MGAVGRRTSGRKLGGGSSYRRGAIYLLALGTILAGLAAPSLAAAANHSFDAGLSLTGGTSVSKLDPVPDPGTTHPAKQFREACGLAVDSQGDQYVASFGAEGTDGRIDIFAPDGEFISEIANAKGPCNLAVDSTGVLYVKQVGGLGQDHVVVRYTPSSYPPTPSTSFGSPVVVDPDVTGEAIAVDPTNDHLLAARNNHVAEYKSAAEGNGFLREFGNGKLLDASGIAVDAATGDILVGSIREGAPQIPTEAEPFVSVVYVFAADGTFKGTIDGSDTPAGGFTADFGLLFPAIDQESGELFVSDIEGSGNVYRFAPASGVGYEYVADSELESHGYTYPARIAVADAPAQPNDRNVYVTSSNTPVSHLFAFTPEAEVGAPIISGTSFADVTSTEAELQAEVNPNGAATTYRFEYVDDASFQTSGFEGAAATPAATLPTGNLPVPVSANLVGLTPGTTYHFRVVAENNCEPETPEVVCTTEGEIEAGEEVPHFFATFPAPPLQGECPNAALRVGPSAFLPDCRAYELVTPVNTGGRPTIANPLGSIGEGFNTPLVTAGGESVIFETFGGAIPGTNGNGVSDRYRAARSTSGWVTETQSPTSSQSEVPGSGGVSADHTYSAWITGGGKGTPDEGSLVLGAETVYLREPDGTFDVLGQGELGLEPEVTVRWISAGGTHAVFISLKQLEEGAPVDGQKGIYDRTSDGALHVVSLLPSNEAPNPAAQIRYQGTSADGSAVAFKVEEAGVTTLYLRLDDQETIPVATGATTFAGLSADGSKLTYLAGGDVFSFDVAGETATPVGSGGESTVVNVSADGSRIYLVSTQILGEAVVPGSGEPVAGEENLYVWNAADESVDFVATVTPFDVEGEINPVSPSNLNGLGLWTSTVVAPEQGTLSAAANDPSRTSPADGRYLVFQSQADLTGYDSGGEREVYRYDAVSGQLLCVSCPPDLAVASAGSYLQGLLPGPAGTGPTIPTNAFSLISNVTDSGQMVFFETEEALVPRDVNGVRDVYEWETDGTGGCARAQGCISLISLGRGAEDSYLYGVSASGRDVFFTTVDSLVDIPGTGGTPAIYDARINGGFATAEGAPECQLSGCQEAAQPPPPVGDPASSTMNGPGNVKPKKPAKKCRKNQRKVKKKGKVRCVAKHHKHKSHKGGSK